MIQEPDAQEDKKPARETASFWRKWLKAAEKAAKPHWKDARAAWAEYEKKPQEDLNRADDQRKKSYPVYWSACKTIEPAFYSRTPKVSTRRRLGVDNDLGVLASKAIERLGDYLLDCTNFDEAMTAAVQDFIHADKTTVQLKYEADFEDVEARIELQPAGDIFITSEGTEWADEVMQDEQGFFGLSIEKQPTNQRIDVMALAFDDILHTPDAKTESEITEKAYRFCMDREAAESRFGEKELTDVRWTVSKHEDSKEYESKGEEDSTPGEFLEGWEIWCKKTEKVIWVTDQVPHFILDIKEDPYGLKGFFPSPIFQIGSKPSKNLYPTPAYWQIKDQLDHLHELSDRVIDLAEKIRRRAIVDGADDELIMALNSLGDGEYIASSKFQQFLDKGGLQDSIYWVPVQELVSSLNEIMSLKESAKNDIYDLFGVPDILRGSSDPLETAAAQTLKSQSAHDRFKYMKKQIAMLASDAIQGMIDLALATFTPDTVADIVGVPFLEPREQELWAPCYELLVNDTSRKVQVDIDTDALTFVDEQARSEQMNTAVSTVMSGLSTVSDMLQNGGKVGMASVALKAVLLSLDMMSPGKEFQSGVKQVAEGLMKELENPPPAPPPPPDYEAMKLQIQNTKLQLEAQAMAMENQNKQIELSIKSQAQTLEQEKEAARIRLDAENQMFEQAAEARYLELETYRATLDELKLDLAARETAMEEMRLAREADRAMLMSVIEAQRSDIAAAQTRPVTISFEVPKRQRRSGRIVQDMMGNPRFEEDAPEVLEYETIRQEIPAGAPGMSFALPTVQQRQGQIAFDNQDNPSIVVDEVLGGLQRGQ